MKNRGSNQKKLKNKARESKLENRCRRQNQNKAKPENRNENETRKEVKIKGRKQIAMKK